MKYHGRTRQLPIRDPSTHPLALETLYRTLTDRLFRETRNDKERQGITRSNTEKQGMTRRNKEKFGIWGATSERERRKMRSAQMRNKRNEREVSITDLMNQFGINISFLKERELDGFSGKDGYV